MFINYEYDNHLYNVKVERKGKEFFIAYGDNEYTASALEDKPGQLKIQVGEHGIKALISEGHDTKYIFIDGNVYQVKRIELTGQKKVQKKEGDLSSPISGTIVSIKVKEGTRIKKGEVIMVIEAMKMEYLIRAPYTGLVKKINFNEKDQIEIGQITAELEKGA
jgi:acetyl/propionyl-CoA carboxylase alpha subunit